MSPTQARLFVGELTQKTSLNEHFLRKYDKSTTFFEKILKKVKKNSKKDLKKIKKHCIILYRV